LYSKYKNKKKVIYFSLFFCGKNVYFFIKEFGFHGKGLKIGIYLVGKCETNSKVEHFRTN